MSEEIVRNYYGAMKSRSFYLPLLISLGVLTAEASAQLVNPTFQNYRSALGGSTADYIWNSFTSETRPAGVDAGTGGTASEWLSGIAPTNGSSAIRFSGNSSFGSDYTDFLTTANGGGIYAFFTQTHFQINSVVPLTGLESLTLQIYLAEGLTGAFGGDTAALAVAPTMTLVTTAGTFTLNASYTLLGGQTSAIINGSPTELDALNYQWDLSSVAGAVENYSINWQTSYHSVTYGADVTESTAVDHSSVLQAVPEPSAVSALIGGFGLLLVFRRRSSPSGSRA